MDEYIQKYLDGDLSDEEALAFTRALESDPKLDTELRAFEHILALAAEDMKREPSLGFTNRVMTQIEHSQSPARQRWGFRLGLFDGARSWTPRLAWAAGLAAVFMIGYMSAQRGVIVPSVDTPSASRGDGATESLRMAQLIYVPENPGVHNVAVAGTFNDWNPEATTMVKRGEVWVVQMLLPADTYEYMFVEDGQRWVTDPLAAQARDDGFGRKNAVLDLKI